MSVFQTRIKEILVSADSFSYKTLCSMLTNLPVLYDFCINQEKALVIEQFVY